jgi:quercetin dioxygenase-like cupin family protein
MSRLSQHIIPEGTKPMHTMKKFIFSVFIFTFGVRGGTLHRLGPGQVFYESPEDVHSVNRNTSKTNPAKFAVFFIKDEGAPNLTPVR